VHPLDADPHKHTVISGSRASAMSKSAQKSFDPATPIETALTAHAALATESTRVEAAGPASALVSTDTPIPPPVGLPHSKVPARPQVRRALFAVAAVVVIALAYGGYALFSDNRDSQNGNDEQSAETTQDARTTTGTIALYAPAESTKQAAAVKPANPGNPAKTAQMAPATAAAPPVAAAPVKPVAPQFRDATQALQAARLAFRANDLSAAQAALVAAQTMQPGSFDAQNLAAELKPLTARRDAALQAAQACAAQQSWPCARQHANEALTIDTSNDTAKSILQRVIRETGWAPLRPHAAAGGPAQAKQFAQAQAAPPNGGKLLVGASHIL
jgi:hypothetical protein